MISIQIRDDGAIGLECDDAGIDFLIKTLTELRGSGSHIHLRSTGAGGRELSDKTSFGEAAIAELIITHGGD